ncbi:flagellar hook-length control protein FliK [Limnohabitans sp. 63ED37-2]|uniref:flagellar hook-length control protein FliK n=1 Tax=Limnohabitans sp. 63ED37-2 TaxID=1678128 RepID=UPI000784C8AF|nr:flagellar hook-length control protein FliK [Limnohabitans sp. 63ED37-2]
MNQLRQAQQDTGVSSTLQDATASDEGTLSSGQEMAAGVQDMSLLFNVHNPEMDSWSLKAVNLGPTLNVITPAQAAPDAQSLEAFARSQGLDENAVQWLLGKPGDTLTPSVLQPSGDLGIPASSAAGLSAIQGAGLNFKTAGPIVPSGSPKAVETQLGPALGEPAPLPPAGSMATLPPANSAFTTGAALWALALNEDAKPVAPATRPVNDTESAEAAAIQIQLMRQPTPAAVWMLRSAMPLEVKSDRANAMPSISESELDLGAEFNPELVDGLMAGLETTSAPGPMASTAHPGAMSGSRPEAPLTLAAGPNNTETAQSAGSDAAERSENIQNLAEKMGQAVGKRMLTEMEKGQWHLKLQLRPATLGHIEVEMRMLSGQLDAVFNAPQALTRELLQEGMTRLKETLNQMGMDVASMQVKDGQTRQNGGKSTPNQASKSTDLVNNDSKSTNSPIITVARHKMGEDGWDVLV